MHFLIPVIVFVTANIWGLFSSIPFTNIDPARSIWNRAIGGVQLASTVYTLDQIPRLIDEQAVTHQLILEYLGGWNATLVSETEPAMTLSPGYRPSAAPLTVADDLFLPLLASDQTPIELRTAETYTSAQSYTHFGDFAQVVAIVILAVVLLIWKVQTDQNKGLADTREFVCQGIGKVLQYQEATWNGLKQQHDTSTKELMSAANELRYTLNDNLTLTQWLWCVAEELRNHPGYNRPVQGLLMAAESNTDSSDAGSAALTQSLQDVLASLDTLRQSIERSMDVWEERLEVFRSGSQDTEPTETSGDTQPTESSGDDPIGASSGGLAQHG